MSDSHFSHYQINTSLAYSGSCILGKLCRCNNLMPTATENFLGELQKISLVLKRKRCQIVIQFMLESKTLIDILSSAPLYKSLKAYLGYENFRYSWRLSRPERKSHNSLPSKANTSPYLRKFLILWKVFMDIAYFYPYWEANSTK